MHARISFAAAAYPIVALSIALLGVCQSARAGGGPENFFLVVNSRSDASLTIANHYVELRKVPSSNVLYLDWPPDQLSVEIGAFRTKILEPILKAIDMRGLSTHIDGIIYSSDFPTTVNFAEDVPTAQRSRGGLSGSITGMTYLWQQTIAKDANYQALSSNGYFRPVTAGRQTQPTHGFRSWYGWASDGALLESGGQRYLLSTMLGVTYKDGGNTVGEVLSYLRTSLQADGSQPKGTVYYAENPDVRSKTRQANFAPAVAELKKLDVAAQVFDGAVPMGVKDCIGVMLGSASFDWKSSGSKFLPGAIADNLTSYGGMSGAHGQTTLVEFLRFGASGSSGTIIEPYALQQKFPHPFIHVHYARGCNLAESFYQSLHGPFQINVVGEPLCRPWADIPQVTVDGLKADSSISGNLKLSPKATVKSGAIDRFELYIDGARVARCGKDETLELDSAKYSDGFHELRIVAIENSAIETQGRLIVPVMFGNHAKSATLTASSTRVRAGGSLKLQAASTGAKSFLFYSNGRILGRVQGDRGELSIDTSKLGTGPVSLRALALGTGGTTSHALAKPILIEVSPK